MKYYSDDKNVQLLISLMKAHGIKKIVTSPGVANITFVISVQRDSYFEVFSSVDERSAAYIACGLAEESGEPVAISCTGATASRNYMPGLTEAYYRKLPILAITSARDIAYVGQNSPQQIDRSVLAKDIAKFSLHLPVIHNKKEEDLYASLINKAILELSHNGGGPVHINLTNGYTGKYTTENLPDVKVIERIEKGKVFPQLPSGKIGIFVGAHSKWSDNLVQIVTSFCEKHNAVVLVDQISNYKGDYAVFHNIITCQQKYNFECCTMDLMIHIGNIHGTDFEHLYPKQVWRVNEDGEARDTFGLLTKVFQMTEFEFFEYYQNKDCVLENQYIHEWKNVRRELENSIPELPFSNIWIAQNTISLLPKNSVIHFGIQNSLRAWNLFESLDSILGYSNTGGFGIDGCISSLIGASLFDKNKLYFGVVGDLAFFYDMNSIGNRHIGNNIRLLMVNNGRGQQFRNPYSAGGNLGEEADAFVAAAGHNGNQSVNLVKHFARDLGFIYLSASNKEEYKENLSRFVDPELQEKSILFEVFPSTEDESNALNLMCNLKSSISREIKEKISLAIGEKATLFISKIVH